MIDFHNHLIPGVDDGATSDAEAREGLDALWSQGVRTIVATPHVEGSLTAQPEALRRRLAEIDAGWSRLQAVVAAAFGERSERLDLQRGAEVMLDTPEPDLADARLRLAGARHVLVEYPFMTVPPQSGRVIQNIVAQGFVPIVAHPERYIGITPDSRLPHHWREVGALLQVNAGSLTGRYGSAARAVVLSLLEQGIVDFMCSDYHSRGRPATASARAKLAELDAGEQADLLMVVNPSRMLDGQPPLPVPPLHVRRTLTERMRRWLR